MITATCNNTKCEANGTSFLMIGEPKRVECGTCHENCELTDPRDDPPPLEDLSE